jgi:hypothetical protein
MTRRSALRASDLDRERVAEHLRQATAEGRIAAYELEDRLDLVFSARTYRQLGAIVSDLPASGDQGNAMPVWATASLGVAGSVGVLAAAAVSSVIFAGIAGVSVAWTLFGRVLFGRARGAPVGRASGAATLSRAGGAPLGGGLSGRAMAPPGIRARLPRGGRGASV